MPAEDREKERYRPGDDLLGQPGGDRCTEQDRQGIEEGKGDNGSCGNR